MLHEILFALLGFHGEIIVDTGSTYAVRKGFDLLTTAEQDQINRIVPLGWYYSKLQDRIRENSFEWKLKEDTNDREQSYRYAITLAFADLLTEYAEDIAYLEQYILSEGPVPLSYLNQYLQKYIIVMPIIYDMAREINDKDIRGCEILDYVATIRSGVPVVNEVLKRLLYHTRTIFVKQCLAWSLYGELDDPGKEFMIQKRMNSRSSNHQKSSHPDISITHQVLSKLQSMKQKFTSPNEYLESYDRGMNQLTFDWLSSYYLRLEYLPESQITLRSASKILFCGKAVKLLQLSTTESYRYSSILESTGYKEFYQYFAGPGISMYSSDFETISRNPSSSKHVEKESVLHATDENSDQNDNGKNDDENLYYDHPVRTEEAVKSYLVSNGFTLDDLDRFMQRYRLVQDNIETSFEYFEPLINDIHDVLSKKLWVWLRDEMKFVSFLHSMRSVYLLGRGEFFQFLLDQILQAVVQDNRSSGYVQSDVYTSITDQARADIVLEDALQHTIKLLGFDDSIISEMMRIHVSTSQFIFPSSILSSNLFSSSSSSTNQTPDAKLLGTAKYKTSKSSSSSSSSEMGYISVCSCDEIVRLTDDIEDYYRYGQMIHSEMNETKSIEEEDDNNSNSNNTNNNRDQNLGQTTNLPSEYYVNGGIGLTDQKYIAKGFSTSIILALDWNAVRTKLSPNHVCFLQSTSQRPFASPMRSHSSPNRRLQNVCLGSMSLTLHNDRYGSQTLGSGAYGVDGITGSISIGISVHARILTKSSSTIKVSDGPTLQYHIRVFVSYMHPSSLAVREGRSQQEDITMTPVEYTSRNVSSKGYQYEILEDKHIDVVFTSDISKSSSTSDDSYKVLNGLDSMKLEIEYTRELISQLNRNFSETINPSSGTAFPSSPSAFVSSTASIQSNNSYVPQSTTVSNSSMVYLIRARLASENKRNIHSFASSANNNTNNCSSSSYLDDLPWDIQLPIDLSKYIRLQGGQAYVTYIGSSLDLNEHSLNASHPSTHLSSDIPIPDNNSSNVIDNTTDGLDGSIRMKSQAISSCLGIDVMKIAFDSKGALSSYPVASTFTSARYPDTTLRLESQVKKFRLWMNLKLSFQFPDTFRVVMDTEGIACYERVFSMLMKIRLVGNALEKLWQTKFRLSNDRIFCHLRHSMLFFISNLLYYLQVDVIDSEFSALIVEVSTAVDMQVVLKAHRNFLSNLARTSFIDNITVQESFDRIIQVCLRFLSICLIIQSESETQNNINNKPNYPNSDLNMNRMVLESLMSSTSLSTSLSTLSLDNKVAKLPRTLSLDKMPIVVPSEELDAIRKEFFSQVSYLFNVMSRIDNKGFMFRLDFNGYLSQVVADNLSGKFSKP